MWISADNPHPMAPLIGTPFMTLCCIIVTIEGDSEFDNFTHIILKTCIVYKIVLFVHNL